MAMKIDYNPIVDAINSRLKRYKIAKLQFQARKKNVILQEANTNLSLETWKITFTHNSTGSLLNLFIP